MADQWADSDKTKMYVSSFNSRPVLHVNDLPDGPSRALTFSDVIDKYGRYIKQKFLEAALRRVGRSFVGQLAQTFVVLSDLHEPLRAANETGKAGPNWKSNGGGRGGRGGRGRGGVLSCTLKTMCFDINMVKLLGGSSIGTPSCS